MLNIIKNLAKLTGKHLCCSLFYNKLAGLRPQLYQKRECNTAVFLWILPNFYEQLFYRTPQLAASVPLCRQKSNHLLWRFCSMFFQYRNESNYLQCKSNRLVTIWGEHCLWKSHNFKIWCRILHTKDEWVGVIHICHTWRPLFLG